MIWLVIGLICSVVLNIVLVSLLILNTKAARRNSQQLRWYRMLH